MAPGCPTETPSNGVDLQEVSTGDPPPAKRFAPSFHSSPAPAHQLDHVPKLKHLVIGPRDSFLRALEDKTSQAVSAVVEAELKSISPKKICKVLASVSRSEKLIEYLESCSEKVFEDFHGKIHVFIHKLMTAAMTRLPQGEVIDPEDPWTLGGRQANPISVVQILFGDMVHFYTTWYPRFKQSFVKLVNEEFVINMARFADDCSDKDRVALLSNLLALIVQTNAVKVNKLPATSCLELLQVMYSKRWSNEMFLEARTSFVAYLGFRCNMIQGMDSSGELLVVHVAHDAEFAVVEVSKP